MPSDSAGSVTSFIRITTTPVAVETRTVETSSVTTFVSVFTKFVTDTTTVELWQPIVHRVTSFEVSFFCKVINALLHM